MYRCMYMCVWVYACMCICMIVYVYEYMCTTVQSNLFFSYKCCQFLSNIQFPALFRIAFGIMTLSIICKIYLHWSLGDPGVIQPLVVRTTLPPTTVTNFILSTCLFRVGLGICSFAHLLFALSLKIANFKEWLWEMRSRCSLKKSDCERISLVSSLFQKSDSLFSWANRSFAHKKQ